MTAEQILEKAKSIFNAPVKVELGELTLDDGSIIYFDDQLTVGAAVWTIVNNENIPLPAGTYTLADGTTFVVETAGVVATISPTSDATDETATEEAPIATEAAATSSTETPETTLSAEDIKSIVLEAIKPLEEKILKLSEEKETAEKKVEELETKLSEEPATDGVTTSPEGKDTGARGVIMKATGKTGLAKVYEVLYS